MNSKYNSILGEQFFKFAKYCNNSIYFGGLKEAENNELFSEGTSNREMKIYSI